MTMILSTLITLFSIATIWGSEKNIIGYFNIGKKPIVVNKENLTRAARDHNQNQKKIKVLLLVNSSFRQSSLSEYKCRFISSSFNIVTAECPESVVPYLTAINGVTYVKRPEEIHILMDTTRKLVQIDQVHGARPANLPEHFTGKNVLVGIMDTEFDTRHPAFLDSAGQTRFVAIWDQNDNSESPNNRYGYGVIKNRQQLIEDTLFALDGHFHGTHTASVAAGSYTSNGFHGVAPDALIAGVKYSGVDIELVNGLEWLFSLADSLNVPCVVNLSIGLSSGPHDGSSVFDRFVDSISGPGKVVVGAVGNDGNKNSHTIFSLSGNETKSTWITSKLQGSPPDTFFYSGIDLWGEPGNTFSVFFHIIDTSSLNYMQSTQSFSTSRSMNYQSETVIWYDSATGLTDTIQLQIGVERSSPLNSKPYATATCFTKNPRLILGVSITAGRNGGNIHAWNVAHVALRSFGMPGFQDGDTLYNVNEIGGTANKTITVGAYVGRTSLLVWDGSVLPRDALPMGGLTHFTGSGPTVDGRVKPDILAPGWTVIGAMSRTGEDDGQIAVWPDPEVLTSRYWASTGTSVASPIVAGVVALMLQADSSLSTENIIQIIQETAIKDEMTGPLVVPENKWGAGKINALGAIQQVLGITRANYLRSNPIKPGISLRNGTLLKVNTVDIKYLALIDCLGRKCMMIGIPPHGVIKLPSISPGVYTAVSYGNSGNVIAKSKLLISR